MTSIAIVRDKDGIAIATDGAAFDDDGLLRQIVSKVEILPHLNLVLTSSGSQLAAHHFMDAMYWEPVPPRNFDEALAFAQVIGERVRREVERDAGPTTNYFTLYFCGYSDARARMETYALKSREWPGVPLPDGSVGTAPALTLVSLPEIFLSPCPPVSFADLFGIALPGHGMTERPDDGVRYAMQVVAANRLVLGGPDEDRAKEDPFCCVGGFLQITRLAKNDIRSEIVHRWPDVIGERMDPMRGTASELVPIWLLKQRDEHGELPTDNSEGTVHP